MKRFCIVLNVIYRPRTHRQTYAGIHQGVQRRMVLVDNFFEIIIFAMFLL